MRDAFKGGWMIMTGTLHSAALVSVVILLSVGVVLVMRLFGDQSIYLIGPDGTRAVPHEHHAQHVWR